MEELFDNIKRTFEGPAGHNENTYDYYNKSARKDITIIRELLNDWFHVIPDHEKKELKSRFRKDFDPSFYELFLFQLFLKLGFQIEIHPEVPNSTKRPDFLLIKDDLEVYIEAKVVTGKSQEQEGFERMTNKFYDDFSRLDSKGFFVNISKLNIKTKKQPSTKAIIEYVQSEIFKLDSGKITQEVEKSGFNNNPVIELDNSDIHIIVELIPVNSSLRYKKRRSIGKYPTKILLGGGEESLKDSISKKAKRYGEMDKPFIVCMNTIDIKTSDKMDIDNAILGSLAWSPSLGSDQRGEKWIRQRDGVFMDNNGPKLKNLSGVLVTKVFPHNIPIANYWLFEHPFSNNRIDFNKLGLDFIYFNDGEISDFTKQNLAEILDISEDWLQ